MNRPLEGIRVLDLTQAYSGPFCTMNLADHGAEVIKIERPGTGDQTRGWGPMKNDYSGYYAYINRNKKGITLNLASEEGKKIFRELVKTADVVCENYKVGVLEKLGFSYEVLKEINPRIIYGSISGFGLRYRCTGNERHDERNRFCRWSSVQNWSFHRRQLFRCISVHGDSDGSV